MSPHTTKAGIQILILGKTNLQPTLFTGGMKSKNIENQSRAINYLDFFSDNFFQI